MLYFAYGMNTNVDGMARRCPAAVSHGHARLLNHVFRFSGPADVIKHPGSFVDGVLWTVTNECLKSLDLLEGFPHYYNRRLKEVWFEDRTVRAITYFMQPGHLDYQPSEGYFDTVLRGYTEHGVPTDQLYNALEVLV